MTKRNPYRTAEKVTRKVGTVLLDVLLVGFGIAIAIILGSAGIQATGSLWGLLLVPAFLVACVLLMGLIPLGYWLSDTISTRWSRAKYKYDQKMRDES